MQLSDKSAKKSPGKKYRWPLLLAALGTVIPLAISIVAALLSRRPQCPVYVTQEQIDSGSCIIGADMSFILVLFAVPFVLISLMSAIIWAIVIWRQKD